MEKLNNYRKRGGTMESFGVFGLVGFIFALIAYTQMQRLAKKVRDISGILKANNLERGIGMDSKAEYLKNYVGQSVKITTYNNELSLSDFKGILESYEEGWVKVKKKNKSRLYKIEDIHFVEVTE